MGRTFDEKLFDNDKAVKIICKTLDSNRGLFSKSEEKVIRYWGRWVDGRVVYSTNKTAQILGVAPQTVQNWLKPGHKWGDYRNDLYGSSMGYDIPLHMIVEEARYRMSYGTSPKATAEEFEWVTLDDIK